MKIKSNLPCNIGLTGNYPESKDGKLLGESPRFTIVARATHEIDDATWALLASSAKGLIASGKLTLIAAPVLSKEAQDKVDNELELSLRAQMAALNERKELAKAAEQDEKE